MREATVDAANGAAAWQMGRLRPFAALVLVGIMECWLFADTHLERWPEIVAMWSQQPERSGEWLVVHNNGLGYYAWLRSLLIDHDWSFDNEFDEHCPENDYAPPPTYVTEVGRRANQWSIGPACAWGITVVPGHFVLKLCKLWGLPWALDGYSLPYQLLVGLTTLVISWIGLGFLFGACKRFARPTRAALAAALLTLGTSIVYYSAIEVSLAHGLGAAATAWLVWYWLKTYGSPHFVRWFLVGCLIGLCALMRWQLATVASLPMGEAVFTCWRTRAALGRRQLLHAGTRLAVAGLGALATFLPQCIAWRCVYGKWATSPIRHVQHNWTHPALWEILVSQDRSLFYWTPLAFIALAGSVWGILSLWRRSHREVIGTTSDGHEPILLLLSAFLIQVYVLAVLWGKGDYIPEVGNYSGVFLSRSFGFRHLTESLMLLGPGLAVLLDRASPWQFLLLTSIAVGFAFWNLLLIWQYNYGMIPQDAGAPPLKLLANAALLVKHDPILILAIGTPLGMLGLLLGKPIHSMVSMSRQLWLR